MKILVTAASRHGATLGIARAIADSLAEVGLDATYLPIERVGSIESYAAVVLGSAVYTGRWMSEARTFVDRHRDELRARPVWLFSSGPLGHPAKPEGEPTDAALMIERTAARQHRVFAGRLDHSRLGFGERAIVRMVTPPRAISGPGTTSGRGRTRSRPSSGRRSASRSPSSFGGRRGRRAGQRFGRGGCGAVRSPEGHTP